MTYGEQVHARRPGRGLLQEQDASVACVRESGSEAEDAVVAST